MERFSNPVEICGWCRHPLEAHTFNSDLIAGGISVDKVPCAYCPDNTCDLSRKAESGECSRCGKHIIFTGGWWRDEQGGATCPHGKDIHGLGAQLEG